MRFPDMESDWQFKGGKKKGGRIEDYMNKVARGSLFNWKIVRSNGDLFLLFEIEIRSCGLELSRFRVVRSERLQ